MRQVTFPSSHEKFPAPSFLVSVRLVECPTSRAANADARDVSSHNPYPVYPRYILAKSPCMIVRQKYPSKNKMHMRGPASERCVGLMKKYFNIGVLRQCEKSLKYKTRKFLQYPLPTLNKETPNNGQQTGFIPLFCYLASKSLQLKERMLGTWTWRCRWLQVNDLTEVQYTFLQNMIYK